MNLSMVQGGTLVECTMTRYLTTVQHLCLNVSLSRCSRSCTLVQVGPLLQNFGNARFQKLAFCYSAVSLSANGGGVHSRRVLLSTGAGIIPRSYTSSTSYSTKHMNVRCRHEDDGDFSHKSYFQTTHGQMIRGSTSKSKSSYESWSLWQLKNCSVKEIAGRRGLSEIEIYNHICWCVQGGKEIDWYGICQEAEFTPAISLDINRAKAEAALGHQPGTQLDDMGTVPVQCGHHVTDVHVLLYNTMMFCGVTPEMLFGRMEEERAKQLENVALSNTVPITAETQDTIKRAPAAEALTMEERESIWTEKGSKQATSFQAPPVDPPVLKRAPVQATAAEERDAKKPPKRLTHKNMLQWLTDKDGATLLEIVLEFNHYNECQLMRLVLLLERKKFIFLKQGIFRVTASGAEALQS